MLTRPPSMGFVKFNFFSYFSQFFPLFEEKNKVLWNPADPPARFVNLFSHKIQFFLKDSRFLF